MSGTTQNIPPPPPIAPPATDLDAHVDALVDRIDAAADSASKALEEIAAEVDAQAPAAEPAAGPVAEPVAEPAPEAESPSHPDDVMSAVAGDIEHAAPGPLAEAPAVVVQDDAPSAEAIAHESEPSVDAVAPASPTSSAAASPLAQVSSAALDDALAAVADDLAEAESARQKPPVPETRSRVEPAGAEVDLEFQSPLPEELAAPEPVAVKASAPEKSDRPGQDVRKLDDELAANAEKVLAQAQHDLQSTPAAKPEPTITANAAQDRTEQPAAPKVEAVQKHPTESVAAAPAMPVPAPVAAPARATDRVEPTPTSVPAPAVPAVEPKPTLGARIAPVLSKAGRVALMPLDPLAAVHRKLGEEMRQTIGYCAILTGFIAACLWVAIPMLKKPVEHSPVTPAAEFYDPSKPAHGVTAPPRHEPEGHGKGDDAHGAAKKDDHGAAKKDAHGAPKKDAHGAAKKDDHGAAKKAEPKKADAHGAKKSTKKADAHH